MIFSVLLATLVSVSSAAAQQVASRETGPVVAAAAPREVAPSIDPWRVQVIGAPIAVAAGPTLQLAGAGLDEVNARRRVSVTGLVIGAVVGAAIGGALACFANKDDYGVYCAGQNDTKVVIGAVIGAGIGGYIGGVLIPRRR